jgi:hypothetical protein
MKRITFILTGTFIAAWFAWPGTAFAQANKNDDQYFPEPQSDEDMRVIESKKNMLSSGVQYGGWITPVIIYQEAPENKLATSVSTVRLWLKTYLWNDSYLYVRGKDTYTAVISQKGASRTKNKNVADLDLGFIAMATKRRDVDFTVGRKYFLLGQGLVLDGRGDGAEFNYYSKYINIKALASWTGWLVKDDNPYGLSDRDIATGAKRLFAGGRLSTQWFNQTLYAFGLAQLDYGKERYETDKQLLSVLAGSDFGLRYYSQRTRYQSQYYGAGIEGIIWSGLSYAGEFIMERGRSYLSGYTSTREIVAYAGIFKLNYYINVLLKPVVMLQYGFGSGDVNREDYRLPNGNLWGKDRGFLYFGTFVGGYALRPYLANMHVISASVAFSPFSWSDMWYVKNMTIIMKYLYYLKYKTLSPINYGLDATRPYRDIGHGVDAALRWLIFSDLSFFVNYGLFIPGKAFGYYYDYTYGTITYSSKAYRHFVMGGFNISF